MSISEPQNGSTVVSTNNIKTPEDDDCRSKQVVQYTEKFKQISNEASCLCKEFLNNLRRDRCTLDAESVEFFQPQILCKNVIQ
jgi:hypothetical protein